MRMTSQAFKVFFWPRVLLQCTVAGDLNIDSCTAHTQHFRAPDQHRSGTEATKSLNSHKKRQVLPITHLFIVFKFLSLCLSTQSLCWTHSCSLVAYPIVKLEQDHINQFLGFMVHSAQMMISLPQKKVEDLAKACQAALLQGTFFVQDLSCRPNVSHNAGSVTGTIVLSKSAEDKNQLLSRSNSFEAMVTLNDSVKEELL